MKNLKRTLACLLSVAMIAAMGALSAFADASKYEAEAATLTSDPAREAAGEHVRINGGLVGWVGSGNTITFTVTAEAAGAHTLTVVHTGPNDRNIELAVNGADPITVAGTDSVAEVELVEGENTIVLGNSTGWAPDIDYIEVEAVSQTPDEPTDDVPETGDATVIAVAVAVVALAGAAVVSKKRHTAE